jgi:hypothetical protein
VIYDIACEWHKNLQSRLRDCPPEIISRLARLVELRYFIPKFHIVAHGPACQTRFSLNWRSGCGRTFGELIEQEWAHIKKVAAATREQGPGARHLTLDDHWGWWNWRRLVGLGKYCILIRNFVSQMSPGETLERALKAADIWEKKMGLVARQHDETVVKATLDEWIQVEAAWQQDHSKEDPYAEPELGMFFFFLLVKHAHVKHRQRLQPCTCASHIVRGRPACPSSPPDESS